MSVIRIAPGDYVRLKKPIVFKGDKKETHRIDSNTPLRVPSDHKGNYLPKSGEIKLLVRLPSTGESRFLFVDVKNVMESNYGMSANVRYTIRSPRWRESHERAYFCSSGLGSR